MYENECRANGHEPGFVQLPADGAPTAVFVADDVDKAWDELGPYLLHDAMMAASYRHGDEGVASISRAADVNGLRKADGPYRVFTIDEAVDYMRGGQALPLAPLCGGVPPDLAWPYLERAAEAAARVRLNEGEPWRQVRVALWCGRPVASAPSRSTPCTAVRISNSSGCGCTRRTRSAATPVSWPAVDPIGVAATNDADALIALEPDCVVYAASGPERDAGAVPDYVRLLEAGINVVSTTSTSLIYPPTYYSPDWRDQLEAAAKAGNASFYGSGIFPGFGSDQLALLLATQSKKIRCIKATEIALNDHYPVADIMMNGLGFGHPLDFEPMLKTPGFIEMAWAAPIHLMADGLGVEVEEVRGSMDRRLTDRDIEVAFGTIKAGTCGAVLTRAAGVVNGREAIVIEHIIRMARDVAPDWLASEFDATYRVDIEGEPDIHCAMNLGDAEGHGAGRAAMAATAMRVVNAIPYVIDAPAGLLSSLDMPNTLPRHAFD